MFKRLLWWFSSVKKIDDVDVNFTLITMNGYNISNIDQSFKLYKTFYQKGDMYWTSINEIERDEKVRDGLNFLADKFLNGYQKKKRIVLANGQLDCGDYIVKCVWDISVRNHMKDMTYVEFLEYKNKEKKNE